MAEGFDQQRRPMEVFPCLLLRATRTSSVDFERLIVIILMLYHLIKQSSINRFQLIYLNEKARRVFFQTLNKL